MSRCAGSMSCGWPRPEFQIAASDPEELAQAAAAIAFGTLAASRLAQRRERALIAAGRRPQFIATLGHELRRPTNGFVGTLDVLSSTDPDEAKADCLRLALDPAQTRLAMINRLLQFGRIEAGRVLVQLPVSRGPGGHRLRRTVSDRGPGIARAQVRVFESFVQDDPAADRRHSGVGLGLAISQRPAAAMEATLRLDPAGPPGATLVFEVALDAAQPEGLSLGQAA